VARYAIADFYRRRTTRPDDAVEAVFDPQSNDPESGNYNRALAAWLPTLIELLPDRLREAVRLYEIDGLTQLEIANQLGISLSGAKSRIQRGRRQLDSILRSRCNLEFDRRGNVIACAPTEQEACGAKPCECEETEP
jgi:RNA polymerase sigma-70 factor (ECF subfamily)